MEKTQFVDLIEKNKKFLAISVFLFLLAILVVINYQHGGFVLSIYTGFVAFYVKIISGICIFVLHFFGYEDVKYIAETAILSIGEGKGLYVMSNIGLKFYFIPALILFIFPRQYLKTVFLFLVTIVIFFVFSIIQICTASVYGEVLNFPIAVNFLYAFRYLVLLFVVMYKVKQHPLLVSIMDKINGLIAQKFHFSIFSLFVVLIFVEPLMIFVDNYLSFKELISLDGFTKLLLLLSKNILSIFGFNAQISGSLLFLDKYWVLLGLPCLGIGLMSAFVFLIVINKSNWINKIIYILIGLVVIILMNSARVALLLYHLYTNKGMYTIDMEVHDLSNYFFYAIVSLMVIVYVVWFQYIEFKKVKNK
jgi:exosortase/archaeosortase family protein